MPITQSSTVVARASAVPPTLSEGQNGALSMDLAGNLRTTGSASTAGVGLTDAELRASAVTVATTGLSAVSVVGTSLVSALGIQPVTLSSTSLTGVSAVSHVGTQPVSLQAAPVTSSVGTITLGAASNPASLATFQLAASNATVSLGTVTLGASSNQNSLATFSMQGLVASDAPVSGNPVMMGGRAATTTPAAISTDGDLVYAQMDKHGRQIVASAPQDLWGQGTVVIAASTATTSVIAAAGGSIKWALTTVAVTSTETATSVRLDIIDGINNGGTLIHSFFYPAGISAQGGGTDLVTFNPPWVCSANTAIGAKCSASVTDVRVVATAFKVL